jgi:flagellar hook-associated protein 1 FlgK
MGLINGSLQIGRSALLTQQSVMQVIGNNIANAGDPNYTRQTAVLKPVQGVRLPDGSDPGSGVQFAGVDRHIDQALEERLRMAMSDMQYDDQASQVLTRIESLYNEMTDSDLSSALSEFFNAWSELQAQPHDMSTRAVVVQTAESLTDQIRTLRDDVITTYNDLGRQLSEIVDQVNYLSSEVARLNVQITNSSAGGKSPSALLDQRDTALKELSKLVDIHVSQQPAGDVTVHLGTEPLVQYNTARKLTVAQSSNGELLVPKVAFEDTGREVNLSSGTAGAITWLIDDFVTGNLQQLDTLGSALIFEVNKIHSSGQGLIGYSSITSEHAVSDATAALNMAGLPNVPQNGTFIITVRDSNTGQDTVHQINVDLNGLGNDTSLTDLASQINAISTLSASVLPNGQLTIQTNSGNNTFTFSEDSSHVLAALGINGFFTGTSSGNIVVNADIAANPQLVAASQNNLAGDGSNAQQIAQLRLAAVDSLGGLSVPDYYRSLVSDLGTTSGSARQNLQIHSAMADTLQAQRESVSGVSLDEEVIAMMTSQQAFQGAARFVTVINELMQEVLKLI